MFGPKLKPKSLHDLDHERDITLAIHAAIPDVIGDTNRHVIPAGSGCMALAGRFRVELTGEAGLAGKDTNPIIAARRPPLQIERSIRWQITKLRPIFTNCLKCQ
jgi:hypothetical protein